MQMPAMAVGGAVSAVVAQNIGAGRREGVGRIARDGVLMAVGLTLALGAALPVLRRFLGEGSPSLPIAERVLHESGERRPGDGLTGYGDDESLLCRTRNFLAAPGARRSARKARRRARVRPSCADAAPGVRSVDH